MKRKARQHYTAEFKAQAIELMETGKPATSATHRKGLGKR